MTRLQLSAVVILTLVLLLSFSANPPQGRTGGPGERTCAAIGCHPSFSAIEGHLELRGLPELISPGLSYNLQLDMIVDQGNAARGGFQMVALSEREVNIGSFSDAGPSSVIAPSIDRTYFEHNPARSFDDMDTLTYSVTWALESIEEANQVIFYAAANFANGDRGASGDRIVLLKDTIQVLQNTALSVDVIKNDVSCPEGDDGTLMAVPQGGTPPYQYLWSTGDTTASTTGLTPDIYMVQVIDDSGLTIADTIILEANDTIPPLIQCVSDTLVIASCAPFSYPMPTATDECTDVNVMLVDGLGPNSSFPSGATLERYMATDASGNSSSCSITIINEVDIAPDISIMDIPCHDDSIGSIMESS